MAATGIARQTAGQAVQVRTEGSHMVNTQKPSLSLVGSPHGAPTLADTIALTKRPTGRDPAPEETERARLALSPKNGT